MRNSSAQKRTRFSIGLSGVNFLKAAIWSFKEERKIYSEHYKRFPHQESGLKSREASKRLSEATDNAIVFMRKLKKSLKF